MTPVPESLKASLEEQRQQLEEEIVRLRTSIAQQQAQLTDAEIRLNGLNSFLGVSRQTPEAAVEESGGNNRSICDLAAQILAGRNGEPMYYKDLAAAVQQRGGNLRGIRPEANLVAKLTSDSLKRFVRPTRKGYYALKSDYPAAFSVGSRKNQREE